jgi:hypothetical protein
MLIHFFTLILWLKVGESFYHKRVDVMINVKNKELNFDTLRKKIYVINKRQSFIHVTLVLIKVKQ